MLSYQLNDSDSAVLLLEDQYVDRLNAVATDLDTVEHVVVSDTDADSDQLDDRFHRSTFASAKADTTSETGVEVGWDDPASVMYTSGTTGRPKGCVLPYQWIFGNYAVFRASTIDRDDTIHYSLPLYHVSATYNGLAPALMAGARVVLWDRFSTSNFWDRVERYDATTTTLVSVMQSWLANQPAAPDDDRNTLTKVQMAPLPENHVEMCRRFGFDLLTGQYGQTECGNPVTGVVTPIEDGYGTPEDLRRGKDPAAAVDVAEALGIPVVDEAPAQRFIGDTMPLLEAAVHDAQGEELPPGEVGEFVVRPERPGILLASTTARPRKPSSPGATSGGTGDAVYRDEKGYFYFVDRIGDVIRRRGENVSSMQIQDAITDHDAVAEAAVFPIPAEEGGEDDIAAIVQSRDGQSVTADALGEHLEPKLPAFMLPRVVEVVEELPTTETNKVEKYRLREELVDRLDG